MWITEFDENEALELPRINAETFDLEEVAPTLALELERELCEKHPLKGFKFEVIAKHEANPNEFVFKTNHPDYPTIWVHLTWHSEKSINFPRFEAF